MANVNGNNAALLNKNTQVATTGEKKPKTIQDYLKDMTPEIAKAVPKHVTPERITRIALTAVRVNPTLLDCTRDSLLAGVMTSAQLGLEPNTPLGHAYLIPYTRSVQVNGQWQKIKEVQFQLGYQGIIDLAYRSGEYKDIYCEEVYSRDEFEYRLGLNRTLEHVPCEDEDRGELTHIYAVYHTKNGGYDFKVWSVGKILSHSKKYSQSWNKEKQQFNGGEKSAWGSNFIGMGKKTVLKDLLKYAPKSIEFARYLEQDDTVKKEIATDMTEVQTIDITDYSNEIAATEQEAAATVIEAEVIPEREETLKEKHERMTRRVKEDE